MTNKEYTGTAYIGVVGNSTVNIEAYASIYHIHTWAGDSGPKYLSATKGFESRQAHINNFLATNHDFLLLLDGDQTFPPDTLDRLRSHKLPYVSGLYMFRSHIPRPIWFKWQEKNEFPMMPYYEIPQDDSLVKLGASGWGCILVHREVILAVRELLKGEKEVIEDDMDIWPYDLPRILKAIKMIELEGASAKVRDVAVATLKEEIRPLRVAKDNIGSDLRFPFFAREAGYTLWGDPQVRCGHIIQYAITPQDLISTAMTNKEGFEANRRMFTEEGPKEEIARLAKIQDTIKDLDVSELIKAAKAVKHE